MVPRILSSARVGSSRWLENGRPRPSLAHTSHPLGLVRLEEAVDHTPGVAGAGARAGAVVAAVADASIDVGAGALGVVEERGGGGQFASPVDVAIGETTLLVLRADLQPGNDRFTLYVNPSPLSPEPPTGIVKQDMDIGGLDGIVLYSTGAHSVDEIRWGTTFADVTPVPEPGRLCWP